MNDSLSILENINYSLEPKIVRIENDINLKEYIYNHGKKSIYFLSVVIIQLYENKYNNDLKISAKSLATEIYDHYKLMEWSLKFEKKFSSNRFTKWMIRHMNVIDCGEKDVDNNRFLWDLLSIFWKK